MPAEINICSSCDGAGSKKIHHGVHSCDDCCGTGIEQLQANLGNAAIQSILS